MFRANSGALFVDFEVKSSRKSMLKKIVVSTVLLTSVLGGALLAEAQPARPSRTCYRVQDPDGWVNVRKLPNLNTIGSLNNGTEFYSIATTPDGKYVILADAPSLAIHASRAAIANGSNACQNRYEVRDRDGYTNLRQSPNGEIIGRVNSGRWVVHVGRSGDWFQVVTPEGQIGYMHGSRLVR